MPIYSDAEIETELPANEPGVYLCEVSEVEHIYDNDGNDVIRVFFIDPASSKKIGNDRLDFSKKFLWIAHKKIVCLGITKNAKGFWDFNASDLLGTRAFITWHNKPCKKNPSKIYFNVDTRAPDTECGYKSVGSLVQKTDDVPF